MKSWERVDPDWRAFALATVAAPDMVAVYEAIATRTPHHERGWTPTDLASTLDLKLSTCAYYVRRLAEFKLIRKNGEEKRRGSVAHFYVATGAARKATA